MKPKLLLGLALVLSGYCHAAIVYPKEPEGGRQMVMKFAGSFVGKDLPPFKGIKTTNELTFTHALPAYNTGDLTEGELLAGAKAGRDGRQSWEYLFMRGSNVVGNTLLEADEKTGKPLKCYGLGNDDFSKASLEALKLAEQWHQVRKEDFEARLLDDTLVSFVAVWLHGKTNDIIIPLPPTYNQFNAYQPYSESQIVKVLAPEAKRAKAMWAKINKQRQENYKTYTEAMMDYEKAHGGKCGAITLYSEGPRIEPIQIVDGRPVWVEILKGKSSKCGILVFKVRVTYADETYSVVKQVEILEKLSETNNLSKP